MLACPKSINPATAFPGSGPAANTAHCVTLSFAWGVSQSNEVLRRTSPTRITKALVVLLGDTKRMHPLLSSVTADQGLCCCCFSDSAIALWNCSTA